MLSVSFLLFDSHHPLLRAFLLSRNFSFPGHPTITVSSHPHSLQLHQVSVIGCTRCPTFPHLVKYHPAPARYILFLAFHLQKMSPSFSANVDPAQLDNDTPPFESANVLVKRDNEHQHKKTKHGKHRQQKPRKTNNKKFAQQLQRKGQRVLAQLPFDLNKVKVADVEKIPLPAGLEFPSGFSLDNLQKIINDFHIQETRTDVLSDLPLDFEPDKSIYSFLYVMNTYRDPEVTQSLFMNANA